MQRGFLDLGFSVPWCHGLIPLPYRNSVFFGWPSQVQSMDFLSLLCDGFNPRKKNKKQHIWFVCVIIVENSNNFKTKNQIGCNLIFHSYSLHPHSRVPNMFVFYPLLNHDSPVYFFGRWWTLNIGWHQDLTPVTASSSTLVGTCCKVPGWKLKRYDMWKINTSLEGPFLKPWMIWEPSYENREFSKIASKFWGRIQTSFQISTCFAASMAVFAADQIWESQWSAGHSPPITHQSTRDPVLPLAEP